MMRREWFTALIKQVPPESCRTTGSRRVLAELIQECGIGTSERLIWWLIHDAGIRRLPGPARAGINMGLATSDDAVERRFARFRLNEMWASDITK